MYVSEIFDTAQEKPDRPMVNLMQCPGYRPFVYYIMLKETEMRGA